MSPIAVCVGCGLIVDGGLLKVHRDPAGGIACSDANGLSVDLGDAPNGLVVGADGLRVDRDEVSGCNGLEVRTNGLYAPCPDSYVCSIITGFVGGTIPISLNTGCPGFPGVPCYFELISNWTGTNDCATAVGACGTNAIQITHPASICCQIRGFWEVVAYGGVIAMDPGFEATVYLKECLDGSLTPSQPLTNQKLVNRSGSLLTWEMSGFHAKNLLLSDPTNVHTYAAAITIAVSAGTATWIAGPAFEFYFHFTQTGCC